MSLGVVALLWGLFLPTPGVNQVSPAAGACLSSGNLLGAFDCLRLTEGQAGDVAAAKFGAAMDSYRQGLSRVRVGDPVLVQLLDRVAASGDVGTALERAESAAKYVRQMGAAATPAPSMTVRRWYSTGEPWLPPSQYTHSGAVDPTGMQAGTGAVTVPTISTVSLWPGVNGEFCWRHITNLALIGQDGFEFDFPDGGCGMAVADPGGWCVAPVGGWHSPYNGQTYPAGTMFGAGEVHYDVSTVGAHVRYTNLHCGATGLIVGGFTRAPWRGSFAQDGFLFTGPGFNLSSGGYTVTCAGGDTHSGTGPLATFTGSVCPAGVQSVEVSTTVDGSTIWLGSGAFAAGFAAWACTIVGNCALEGTGDGSGGFSDCQWRDTGSGEMWALLGSDCSDAQSHGIVPGPVGGGVQSPTPTPSPSAGSDPVLEAVKRILEGIASDVGRIKSWLEGVGSAFDRAKASADDKSHGINASQAEGIVNWWGPLMGKMPTESAYSEHCGFSVHLLGYDVPLCPLPSMVPIMTKLRELADVAIPLTLLVNLLWSLAGTFRLHGDTGR